MKKNSEAWAEKYPLIALKIRETPQYEHMIAVPSEAAVKKRKEELASEGGAVKPAQETMGASSNPAA